MNFGKNVRDRESKNIKVSFFKAKYRIHFSNDYIKDKYLNTYKDIYRCEVSLTTHSLNRIVNDIIKVNDLDTEEEGLTIFLTNLEDNDYIQQLHKESMFRLIRYSHPGRRRKTLVSYYNINH